MSIADRLIAAAQELCTAVNHLKFKTPVAFVYNPLDYAWHAHETYLRKYGASGKRVVFLGMNPGPFGMAQVGVPFGEINAVREWMKIETAVGKPRHEHPKRPVEGFACQRSEVSGRRLWGLFATRFVSPEGFFEEHFVINYCPLAFFDAAGRNLTPDKLPARQSVPLFAACDRHLRRVVETLQPEWLVGVGDFAERRARLVLERVPVKVGKILHPSPASPAANEGWARKATLQLGALGIWKHEMKGS